MVMEGRCYHSCLRPVPPAAWLTPPSGAPAVVLASVHGLRNSQCGPSTPQQHLTPSQLLRRCLCKHSLILLSPNAVPMIVKPLKDHLPGCRSGLLGSSGPAPSARGRRSGRALGWVAVRAAPVEAGEGAAACYLPRAAAAAAAAAVLEAHPAAAA